MQYPHTDIQQANTNAQKIKSYSWAWQMRWLSLLPKIHLERDQIPESCPLTSMLVCAPQTKQTVFYSHIENTPQGRRLVQHYQMADQITT